MTVILVLSRNTVTPLARRGTVPHRHLDCFFYSSKNYFVQLEDTTIKTERSCSMQCTDRTRVLHHSSLGLHCQISARPDFLRRGINFNKYNAVTVCNSGGILTGAGSLTISRSQTSFQNSLSVLYSFRSPVQPALGPLWALFCFIVCAQHV